MEKTPFPCQTASMIAVAHGNDTTTPNGRRHAGKRAYENATTPSTHVTATGEDLTWQNTATLARTTSRRHSEA